MLLRRHKEGKMFHVEQNDVEQKPKEEAKPKKKKKGGE